MNLLLYPSSPNPSSTSRTSSGTFCNQSIKQTHLSSPCRKPIYIYLLLLLHGFTAFALNVSNFEATKSTSPLVINIAGNVKQVCMIIISVIVFKQPLSASSVIGCIMTIAGSFWYSVERYKFDNRNKKVDNSYNQSDSEKEEARPLMDKSSPVRQF